MDDTIHSQKNVFLQMSTNENTEKIGLPLNFSKAVSRTYSAPDDSTHSTEKKTQPDMRPLPKKG